MSLFDQASYEAEQLTKRVASISVDAAEDSELAMYAMPAEESFVKPQISVVKYNKTKSFFDDLSTDKSVPIRTQDR